jgi:hypothetical protein
MIDLDAFQMANEILKEWIEAEKRAAVSREFRNYIMPRFRAQHEWMHARIAPIKSPEITVPPTTIAEKIPSPLEEQLRDARLRTQLLKRWLKELE